MDGNLVLVHILSLQDRGERDNTRADDEERGLELFLIEVVEQLGGVESWAIIIGQTPMFSLRTLDNIGLTRATAASPPASVRIGSSSGISRTTT